MKTMEYLFGDTTYLGLLLFLLVIYLLIRSAESVATGFWERYGDRISNMFRQSRL